MTDALKAAVREALVETHLISREHSDKWASDLTFALARRGVVVAERGQKAAMDRLKESAQCYYAANVAGQDKVEGTAYDLFESAEAVLAFCTSPQAAAGESPAPKPARKVINRQYIEGMGWLSFCDDDTAWSATVDGWSLLQQFAPIPQPGDEQ
jgi:hypothetical protein